METKVKYVPKVCGEHEEREGKKTKKVPATFSGHVLMRVPSFDERYEVLEQQNLEIEDGVVVSQAKENPFASLRVLVKNSEKFYVEVELVRLKDKKEFKSFAELSADPGCDVVLIDIAGAVRRSFQVGEA